MDLKQLEYFVAVVEHGGFSRAAAALNLAQSSLSRQVALLETELGHRLLVRTGRGVSLSEAGTALLAHARTMLAAAAQAKFEIREMSTAPSGRVVVGLPHRVALALCVPLIEEFRARFPRAMISVVEGLSLSLRDGLLAGRIDVGLLFDPPPTPLLRFEPLLRERLLLVAPASYRLPAVVSLQALKDFPMVLPGSPNPIRNLVDAILLPRKITLNILAEVGAVQPALNLVAAGVACSILPESALMAGAPSKSLVSAPIGPPAMWNQLVLAMPTARPLNRLGLETIQLLRTLDFRKPAKQKSRS